MLRWCTFVIAAVAWGATPAAEQFRLERRTLPAGAELLTVFGNMQDGRVAEEVPLLAVLRDTFGDDNPANDRLRYVWILTTSHPSWLQRAASATPFYYWRAGFGKNANHTPSPVLDLSAPTTPVWGVLTASAAQMLALDPGGAILRSTSRSYRNNARDSRQMHLLEGLAVLSQLEYVPGIEQHLSEAELLTMQARLALAGQTFGGLVSEANLPEAYHKQRTRTTEERGHNWELLRQRAEANGLYFEPFGLNGATTQALLWVAKEDLQEGRDFEGQFLSLSDPYRDASLKTWSGYSETRTMEDGQTRELIPLGLYSLYHPKAPLLLVDFRNTRAPRRREMLRHAMVDALAGVVGYSRWGNWPYFAGSWTWSFIHARHGAPDNRTARIRAYGQVRQWLALDPTLNPTLRADLQKRLEVLGVNPLEDNVFDEAAFARGQYAALLAYTADAKGLGERLDRDRGVEEAGLEHGFSGRAGLRLAHIASFGLYTPRWSTNAPR